MPTFNVTDEPCAGINYEIIEGVLPRDTLFIHGNMASLRWWYPAETAWRKKTGGREKGSMILAEFRGCGKSSAPKAQSEVDMKLFARDFISLIRSMGRNKVNLVGHSTGGLIAALMLAEAPELFDRAVLLDPVGARGVTFDDSMTAAFEQMKTDKNLVALVMGSTIKDNNPESDFFRQIVVEDGFQAVQTVGDRVLRALNGLDVRRELEGVRHFALVLHGEHDKLLPMEDSKALAGLMKNAEFQIIPDQGHCANVESPEKFVEIAHDFLFPSSK